MTLARFVGIRPDDTLITLGDYVNRGPNSCAVIDWLIHQDAQGKLIPLRGNHEIMMLDASDNDEAFDKWLGIGGKETLKSYSPFDGEAGSLVDIPQPHWDFLQQRLRAFYETETHFFVHANAYAELPLAEQPDYMLYWERFDNPPRHESGKIMVCRHTSQKSGLPATNGNAICIDTWAYGRGWLTCLLVETGVLYQANEAGETRLMHLDEL